MRYECSCVPLFLDVIAGRSLAKQSPRPCRRLLRISTLSRLNPRKDIAMLNKKPFIHSGTKSSLRGTTRITFSSWNIQTFPRSNLLTSLLRYNGLLRHRLLQFTDEVSLARNRRVRSCCLVFPFDTGAGLPPHSPNSLTG